LAFLALICSLILTKRSREVDANAARAVPLVVEAEAPTASTASTAAPMRVVGRNRSPPRSSSWREAASRGADGWRRLWCVAKRRRSEEMGCVHAAVAAPGLLSSADSEGVVRATVRMVGDVRDSYIRFRRRGQRVVAVVREAVGVPGLDIVDELQ
jgi:hypothetical protein